MKKIPLSGFDIAMIAVFVVITLLGGGAWFYLSGQLQTAQGDVTSAKTDFDRVSVSKLGSDTIVVNAATSQALKDNIDLLTQQLTPLIKTKLESKENKLASIADKDPVAWKHELDDDVSKLTAAAKVSGVALPPSFYFGFSHYLSQSPGDEQTAVLSKQLIGIDQISTILIKAPVKTIRAIRRTYEENQPVGGGGGGNNGGYTPGVPTEADRLNGFSFSAPGDAYRDYPFEVEFDTTPENLRMILDGLVQSPYIFVLRTMSVESDHSQSPKVTDLQKIAATPSSSVVDTSPGEVANTTSTKGPQYLFGDSTLHIKARIDLIEWTDTSIQ